MKREPQHIVLRVEHGRLGHALRRNEEGDDVVHDARVAGLHVEAGDVRVLGVGPVEHEAAVVVGAGGRRVDDGQQLLEVLHQRFRGERTAPRPLHLRTMQIAQHDEQISIQVFDGCEIRRAERELHKGVMHQIFGLRGAVIRQM